MPWGHDDERGEPRHEKGDVKQQPSQMARPLSKRKRDVGWWMITTEQTN